MHLLKAATIIADVHTYEIDETTPAKRAHWIGRDGDMHFHIDYGAAIDWWQKTDYVEALACVRRWRYRYWWLRNWFTWRGGWALRVKRWWHWGVRYPLWCIVVRPAWWVNHKLLFPARVWVEGRFAWLSR